MTVTKPELFLHVGLPKTGTTSAQAFMSRNRDQLALHGVYYPETIHDLFQSEHQHRFVFAAIINEYNQHGLNVEAFDFSVIDALAAEMLSKGLPKNLISEENLSWYPLLQSAALERFSKWFDVKIVVFLRRQDQWLESVFTQLVRGGYDGTIAMLLEDIRTPDRLNYSEFLNYWTERFGEQALVVRRHLGGGKSTESMLLEILELPDQGWIKAPRLNDSLSLAGVRFHRALAARKLNFDYGAFNELFDEELVNSTSGRAAVHFSRKERTAFLKQFRDINREVGVKYGLQMDTATELFAFDPKAHPLDADEIDGMSEEELDAILKRLIANPRIRDRSSLEISEAMLVAATRLVITNDVVAK